MSSALDVLDNANNPTRCFHCGTPVPSSYQLKVIIEGVAQPMCCNGCQAVAQAIVDNGLGDFYNFRTEHLGRPSDLVPETLRDWQLYDSEQLQRTFVKVAEDGNLREASLILEGISCAACVWLNERHVRQLAGVLDFRVNYSTHRASLKWDNSRLRLSAVLEAIQAIGYYAYPFDPGRLESLQKKEKSAALRRIAVAGLGMMQVMMIAIAMYIGAVSDMDAQMQTFLRWMSLLMTIPVVFYSARVFFTSAWRDVRRKRFGMDVPVSLAIGIAFTASVWATLSNTGEVYFDSVAMFTFFLLTGRYLEMSARHRAGQVAEELIRLIPASATRLLDDGQQEIIAVSQLLEGDIVLIRPGEVVPADGAVIDGVSSINESLLTGESLPSTKTIGDGLVGGTVNIESPLTMRVEKVGEQTVLAAIIHLLERAQSEKPELARLAEYVASRFVPLILLTATAVFAYWYQFEPSEAFWIALSVLVITCPCAFSLATPTALTATTGLLTSKGVLTTRGHALETLARIEHMIFDKTGTLTMGELRVSKFEAFPGHQIEDLCAIAAGLEQSSEHPLGRAIARLSETPHHVEAVTVVSGRGVQAFYQQQRYRIGSAAYVEELVKQPLPILSACPGESLVYVGREGAWIGYIALADRLRDESAKVVKTLQALGIQVTLLSGDTPETVQHIAQQLGITQALGAQLPMDKLAYVSALQAQGKVVAMVGDGVNDAPVLAGATVSIAMGGGSQLAQASADMVLLSENLQQLPFAVRSSRRMQAIIKQNFAWTIAYNLLAIPLAASGVVLPWMAAIGMSASSLIVVLNSLRLRSY